MSGSRFRSLPPDLLTFGIMAVMLSGIIGLEVREALNEAPAPAAPTRQQSEEPPAPGLGSVPSDQTARNLTAILERPLFSPSRRPDETAANKVADMGRLTGVLVSPAGKVTIFAGSAGGKPVVVREGGHIGEYVISSIDVGAVTLAGPAGQRILHPTFDPSPPPPKPVVPAKPGIPTALIEQLAAQVKQVAPAAGASPRK
jgi:hypothetical protein